MLNEKFLNRSEGESELKYVIHLLNDLNGDIKGKSNRLMMLEELYQRRN